MTAIDLGRYISAHIRSNKINIKRLCENTGLNRSTLYALMNGERKEPNFSTIVSISRHLRIHPLVLMRELFSDWVFNPVEQTETRYLSDAIGFAQHAMVSDSVEVVVNDDFSKTWEIVNIGKEVWENRSLVCVDFDLEIIGLGYDKFVSLSEQAGLKPLVREIHIPETRPNETVQLSAQFVAPSYPCTVVSYWKMVDQAGKLCFPQNKELSCRVRVVEG